MKKYFSLSYLKQIAYWLWKGKWYLSSLIVIVITTCYIVGTWDPHSHAVSALFSLTGLGIILWQLILDSQKFADQNPNTPVNWIRSFPTMKSVTISAGVSLGLSASCKGCATSSISDSLTIEQKVDILLRQVEYIQNDIHRLDDRVDQVDSSLKKESSNLKRHITDLGTSLTDVITGHIVGAFDITFFGIIITVCGTLIQLFSGPPTIHGPY